MIPRFLELSVVTVDIRASLAFYAKLGFTVAPVGEAWPHPYAALTDGRICIGLHQDDTFVTSTTFVRPSLSRHVRELEQLGVALDFSRLADDVFNEVGWYDPAGNMIRLVEARTFSPVGRPAAQASLCGYFVEIALPVAQFERTKVHWEQLGFVGLDQLEEPMAHVACTSDCINIGLYDPAHIHVPTLIFEVDDCAATLKRLEANGIVPSGRAPRALKAPAAQLRAPEGTVLLLSEAV